MASQIPSGLPSRRAGRRAGGGPRRGGFIAVIVLVAILAVGGWAVSKLAFERNAIDSDPGIAQAVATADVEVGKHRGSGSHWKTTYHAVYAYTVDEQVYTVLGPKTSSFADAREYGADHPQVTVKYEKGNPANAYFSDITPLPAR